MRFLITSLLFLFSLNLVGQEIKTPPRQIKEGTPGDVMTTNQAGVVHRRAAILVDTQFVASYVAGDIVKVSTTGTMYRAVIPATYPFNVNDAAWFPVDTRLLAGEVQAFEADATALNAVVDSSAALRNAGFLLDGNSRNFGDVLAGISGGYSWLNLKSVPRKIYVFGLGQSNMDGRDPAGNISSDPRILRLNVNGTETTATTTNNTPVFAFAKKWIAERPLDTVVVLKVAEGGTSITQWGTGGTLRNELNAVMANTTAEPDYILWMQGEADRDNTNIAAGLFGASADSVYVKYFNDTLVPYLATLSAADVPIVLGEVSDVPTSDFFGIGRNDAINAIGADANGYTLSVRSAELSTIDNLHFTGAAVDTLGSRMYYAAIAAPYYSTKTAIDEATADVLTAVSVSNCTPYTEVNINTIQDTLEIRGQLKIESPAGGDGTYLKVEDNLVTSGDFFINNTTTSAVDFGSFANDTRLTAKVIINNRANTRAGFFINSGGYDTGGAGWVYLFYNTETRLYYKTPGGALVLISNQAGAVVTDDVVYNVDITNIDGTNVVVSLNGVEDVNYTVPANQTLVGGNFGVVTGLGGMDAGFYISEVEAKSAFCVTGDVNFVDGSEVVFDVTGRNVTARNDVVSEVVPPTIQFDAGSGFVFTQLSGEIVLIDSIKSEVGNSKIQSIAGQEPELYAGSEILFTGTDTRMTWDNANLSLANEYSLIVRFRTDGLFDQDIIASTAGTNDRFGMTIRNSSLGIGIYDGAFNTFAFEIDTGLVYNTVVFTKTFANVITCFVNGVEGVSTTAASTYTSSISEASIGRMSTGARQFTGAISDIVYYDSVLSNAEAVRLTDSIYLAGINSAENWSSYDVTKNLSVNDYRITSVAAPTAGTDAANKDYVDANDAVLTASQVQAFELDGDPENERSRFTNLDNLKLAASKRAYGEIVTMDYGDYQSEYVLSLTNEGFTPDSLTSIQISADSFLVLKELVRGELVDVRKLGLEYDSKVSQTALFQTWLTKLGAKARFEFIADTIVIGRFLVQDTELFEVQGNGVVILSDPTQDYYIKGSENSVWVIESCTDVLIKDVTFTFSPNQSFILPVYGSGANGNGATQIRVIALDMAKEYGDVIISNLKFIDNGTGAVAIAQTGAGLNYNIPTYKRVEVSNSSIVRCLGELNIRGNFRSIKIKDNYLQPDLRLGYYEFENLGRIGMSQEAQASNDAKLEVTGNIFNTAALFMQNYSQITCSENTFKNAGYYFDDNGDLQPILTEAEYNAIPVNERPPEGTLAVFNGYGGGIKMDNAGYEPNRSALFMNNRHFGSRVITSNLTFEGTDIATKIVGCTFDAIVDERVSFGTQRHQAFINCSFANTSTISMVTETTFQSCKFLGQDSLAGNITVYPYEFGWDQTQKVGLVMEQFKASAPGSRARFSDCTFESRRFALRAGVQNMIFDNCNFDGYTFFDISSDVVPASASDARIKMVNCKGGRFLDRAVASYPDAVVEILNHDYLHMDANQFGAFYNSPSFRMENIKIVGYDDNPYLTDPVIDTALWSTTIMDNYFDETADMIEPRNSIFIDQLPTRTRPKRGGNSGAFSYVAEDLQAINISPFISHTGPLGMRIPLAASTTSRHLSIELSFMEPIGVTRRVEVNLSTTGTTGNAFAASTDGSTLPIRVALSAGSYYLAFGDNSSTFSRGIYTIERLTMSGSAMAEDEFSTIISGIVFDDYASLSSIDGLDMTSSAILVPASFGGSVFANNTQNVSAPKSIYVDQEPTIERVERASGSGVYAFTAQNVSALSLAPTATSTGPLMFKIPLPPSTNDKILEAGITISQPRSRNYKIHLAAENNVSTLARVVVTATDRNAGPLPVRVRSTGGFYYIVVGDNTTTFLRGTYLLDKVLLSGTSVTADIFETLIEGVTGGFYANLNSIDGQDFSSSADVAVYIGNDDLGNHTATQDIIMGTNSITTTAGTYKTDFLDGTVRMRNKTNLLGDQVVLTPSILTSIRGGDIRGFEFHRNTNSIALVHGEGQTTSTGMSDLPNAVPTVASTWVFNPDGSGQYRPDVLSATATLDFPSTDNNASSDLTITVTGAAVGDPVSWGGPIAPTGDWYSVQVTAANTVTLRFNNQSGGVFDPPSATYKVRVFK